MYRVKLFGHLDLGGPDRDGRKYGRFAAEVEIEFPFVPTVGMYLGPTNAVQVDEVYWLGYNRFECRVSFWNDRGHTHDFIDEYTEAEVFKHLTHGVKTAQQLKEHSAAILPWVFTKEL